jgi:hypothetical protein
LLRQGLTVYVPRLTLRSRFFFLFSWVLRLQLSATTPTSQALQTLFFFFFFFDCCFVIVFHFSK